MTIQFWTDEPTVLFNNEYILEVWPTPSMTFEQKLNAMTRLILLLTILGYIITRSYKWLVISGLTLMMIVALFYVRTKAKHNEDQPPKEGFQQNDASKFTMNSAPFNDALKSEFKEGTKKNPFSNVLLTQINEDPDRKSAPPAFNTVVDENITKNVKKTIQMLNPGIKNTNKQLFGDLWQQFQLDNFLRVFNTTPNSRVVNDQGAYAQYLYNDLKYSGKESTPEGAIARVKDNWRWIDG
jgi:hypothetical protein